LHVWPENVVHRKLIRPGRQRADDTIDFTVVISGIKKIGEHVDLEEPLLLVHARNEQSLPPIVPILEKAVEIS